MKTFLLKLTSSQLILLLGILCFQFAFPEKGWENGGKIGFEMEEKKKCLS